MIHEIREQKVMLDSDLAHLYEVPTNRLNEAVKRNSKRFPPDFMFQLTDDEWESLKSQFAISKNSRGVSMLSTVLNSERAIEINISIMRTFVQLRHYVLSKPDTNVQIAELRKLLLLYIDKNDKHVNDIITAMNNLISQPKPVKRIGFNTD